MAVRVWPAEDYSRVTLESDVPLTASPTLVEDPPRLAVDIKGLQLNSALKELVAKVQPDDPNIAAIRIGQNSPTVVRIVIDLKQAAKPQVFTLKPIAPYKHRLVLDLYPAKEVDPLEELIHERINGVASGPAEPDAPATPAEDDDPLGALIAQHHKAEHPQALDGSELPATRLSKAESEDAACGFR